MSGITLDQIDSMVASKAISEVQAKGLRAAIAAAESVTGEVKSASRSSAAKAEVEAGRRDGRVAALPKMPTPINVRIGETVYRVEGATHYGPADARKLRAVPVVTITPSKGKAVSINAAMLTILTAKRSEVDAMLGAAADALAVLRSSAVGTRRLVQGAESTDDVDVEVLG